MHGSQAYTLRKTGRMLIRGHTGHSTGGNVRSLVAKNETEFEILTFWTY